MKKKWTSILAGFTLAIIIVLSPPVAYAQETSSTAGMSLEIPDGARAGPDFDVDEATDAYINLLSEEDRARSDSYMEGGYWLQLWVSYMAWGWPGYCWEPGFLPGCVTFRSAWVAGHGCTRWSIACSTS